MGTNDRPTAASIPFLSSPTRRPRASGVAALLAIGVGLSGCGQDGPAVESTTGLSAECEEYLALEPPTAAETVAVVTDLTASGRAFESLPGFTEVMSQAQSRGAAVLLVGVDGPGVQPPVVGPLPLDPSGGKDSANADNGRALALSCALAVSRIDDLAPTVPGSDILAAVAVAVRSQATQIVVVSDGVSVGGVLDVASTGFEPNVGELVAQLTQLRAELPAVGTSVTWLSLGETEDPLSSPARAGLESVWSAALAAHGATVTFDTRVGAPMVISSSLPADEFAIPTVDVVTTAQATCATLPASLLFAPESAVITDATALDVLAGALSGALSDHPNWEVLVIGHAADYGTTQGQLDLSRGRAEQTAAHLRVLLPLASIKATGVGAEQPRANEWPDGPEGQHSIQASAANRVVDVVYGPAASLGDATCSDRVVQS